MATEDPAPTAAPPLRKRERDWAKLVAWGIMIAVTLFFFVVLIAPMFIKTHRHYPGQREHNNARQISLALFEFEAEYGTFPSPATGGAVEKDFGTAIDLSGASSNALFRQLFAVEFTQSESMFYAKTKGSRRPDGDITPGNILDAGECGFSYIP